MYLFCLHFISAKNDNKIFVKHFAILSRIEYKKILVMEKNECFKIKSLQSEIVPKLKHCYFVNVTVGILYILWWFFFTVTSSPITSGRKSGLTVFFMPL